MKEIFMILTLLFLIGVTFSQNQQDSTLQEFASYFEDSSKGNIPNDFFLNNYNSVCSDSWISVVYPRDMFVFNQTITFILKISYPWDTPVFDYYYLTFDTTGNLLDHKKFAGTKYDLNGGGKYSTYEIFADSIMQVLEKIDNQKRYSHYLIQQKGVKRLYILKYPSKKRKYPYTTERFVTKKELLELSISELDIMRNEIFADYGYIFKTQKWKDYFTEQDWYHPLYENVDDKISIIEKINIATILKLSDR